MKHQQRQCQMYLQSMNELQQTPARRKRVEKVNIESDYSNFFIQHRTLSLSPTRSQLQSTNNSTDLNMISFLQDRKERKEEKIYLIAKYLQKNECT
jgi:hypothetical protein